MSVVTTDARAQSEISALREMVDLFSSLSGLASQDSDLGSVVDLLVRRLGGSATVLDHERQVLAAAGSPTGRGALEVGRHSSRHGSALEQLIDAAGRTGRTLTLPAGSPTDPTVVVAPVLLGDRLAAHLLTFAPEADDRAEDVRLMVTEHAAMVCAIILGRAEVVAAAAGQARRDLFEGLLLPDRNPDDVEAWARHLGIGADDAHHVVTIQLDDAVSPGAAAFVERYLQNRSPESVVMVRGEEIVAIVPAPHSEPAELEQLLAMVRRCRTTLETRFDGVRASIGVGGRSQGAGRIARSYAEARRALETSRMLAGLGGVVVFGDLGIHRLLVRVREVGDLREFAHDVLGPLVDQDAGTGSDYLTTLTVYFHENNSPRRTARRLHMHPNTVSYRIRRAEEILGLSLAEYTDRLLVQVALEIVNGLGDRA